MKKIHHTLLLFLIIIVEGYVVLSTELLAIRQTIPFVGSGTDTVSIIIAAVLMPLAFGYQYGGQFKPHCCLGHHLTVRNKLILNMLLAATILLPGMSYRFLVFFFPWLASLGIDNRLIQISIYSILFLVIPVFLLGQTVPLITNFFAREKLSKVTGRILFFSTVGSFLGATFSTLVLMPTLGVHHTVTLNFVLLTSLVILLVKHKTSKPVFYIFALTLIALAVNSNFVMRKMHVVKNNVYNTIKAGTLKNGNRILMLNGNYSSMLNDNGGKFPYIEFAEDQAIIPTLNSDMPPIDILVIGAGGFTLGAYDDKNNYTYVDIDKDLKEVAEKYILEEKLWGNKDFEAVPARAFLQSTDKKFDFIFLDAYQGGITVPEHLVTQEFYQELKKKLKNKGILIANFVLNPNFGSALSRNIDNTFRSVFPHFSRHAIGDNYALYSDEDNMAVNVMYIYRHEDNYDEGHIYTDDKNTVFYDKPKRMN